MTISVHAFVQMINKCHMVDAEVERDLMKLHANASANQHNQQEDAENKYGMQINVHANANQECQKLDAVHKHGWMVNVLANVH